MRLAAMLLATLLLQDEKVEKGVSPCRALRPARDEALQKRLQAYEFAEKEFSWQLREIKQTDKAAISWLTFRSAVRGDIEENNTVWAKFWLPRDGLKRRPAALLLHWLGGSFEPLEAIGQRLSESGIAALMMYMPHYGPRRARERERREKLLGPDMDKTMANLRQAVLDARRAGDWLAARPDVEPSRVGIVGVSLGAVIGSLTAGVDDRFSRSVFLIGGGDLPAIVMHDSKETADQKKRLEEAGYTLEKLRELWKGVEPCTYASRVRPEEILMINAESDEVIPRPCTEKLHEAMGRPEIRWFKGGHYAVLFQIGPVLKEVTAHLSQRTAYARLEEPVIEK